MILAIICGGLGSLIAFLFIGCRYGRCQPYLDHNKSQRYCTAHLTDQKNVPAKPVEMPSAQEDPYDIRKTNNVEKAFSASDDQTQKSHLVNLNVDEIREGKAHEQDAPNTSSQEIEYTQTASSAELKVEEELGKVR